MTDERKSLLDKIKKLMALGRSPNANEAAAAMAKVADLMAQAGVSDGELARSEISTSQVKSRNSVSRAKDWELALVSDVARCFSCKLLWLPGVSYAKDYYGRYEFVGPRDYVVLAQYAADTLLRQLTKERASYSKKLSDVGHARGKAMSSELDGFSWGWVETVSKQSQRFAKETNAELSAVVDEYVTEIAEGREAKMRGTSASPEGLRAGVLSAASVELQRPMTAGSEQLRVE